MSKLRFVAATAVVLLTIMFAPFWLYVFVLLAYTSRYPGYVCIGIAAGIDGFYGQGAFLVPLYTLVTTGVVAVMTLVRPRLSWS